MNRPPLRPLTALLVTAVWLAACGGGEAPAPPSAESDRPVAVPATPAELGRAAVAARLELPIASVSVVSVTARDFPDASLDCPEPGMAYAQVITPGHEVIVEAEGRRFDVRVAGSSARICHRRKGGGGSQRASPAQRLAEQAQSDLAVRLQSSPDAVTITGIRALAAGDELPGCRWDCAAGAEVCGYAVSLEHRDRRYEYYASQARVMPCPPIVTS